MEKYAIELHVPVSPEGLNLTWLQGMGLDVRPHLGLSDAIIVRTECGATDMLNALLHVGALFTRLEWPEPVESHITRREKQLFATPASLDEVGGR